MEEPQKDQGNEKSLRGGCPLAFSPLPGPADLPFGFSLASLEKPDYVLSNVAVSASA